MSETNATFFYDGHDHTLGNLLRERLSHDPEVIFTAYQVPHPLARSVEVRVVTMGTPTKNVVDSAIDSLCVDVKNFGKSFKEALNR